MLLFNLSWWTNTCSLLSLAPRKTSVQLPTLPSPSFRGWSSHSKSSSTTQAFWKSKPTMGERSHHESTENRLSLAETKDRSSSQHICFLNVPPVPTRKFFQPEAQPKSQLIPQQAGPNQPRLFNPTTKSPLKAPELQICYQVSLFLKVILFKI